MAAYVILSRRGEGGGGGERNVSPEARDQTPRINGETRANVIIVTRYERIIDRKPPLVDESIWHVQGFIPSPILRTNMRREIKGKKIHEGERRMELNSSRVGELKKTIESGGDSILRLLRKS